MIVILVGPEPRQRVERDALAEHVGRSDPGLCLGVLPGFLADRRAVERAGEFGHVARGKDTGRAGGEVGIDDDAAALDLGLQPAGEADLGEVQLHAAVGVVGARELERH